MYLCFENPLHPIEIFLLLKQREVTDLLWYLQDELEHDVNNSSWDEKLKYLECNYYLLITYLILMYLFGFQIMVMGIWRIYLFPNLILCSCKTHKIERTTRKHFFVILHTLVVWRLTLFFFNGRKVCCRHKWYFNIFTASESFTWLL